MPRPPYRSELLGAEVVLVLSVTWAGRVYRWSDRPAEATTADGEVLLLDGGLPPLADTTSAALINDTPTLRTFSASVVFPVDVAELESTGHDLAAAVGELARWRVGSSWEDREVLLARGAVTYPEYGAEGEPVTFTLEQSPFDDAALIPEAAAVVDAATWPEAHESALGAAYPLPLGQPGYYTDTSGQPWICRGSPALIVEWGAVAPSAGVPATPDLPGAVSTLLISAYPVGASSVYVIDPDGAAEVFAVQTATDGRGRAVAVVDMSAAAEVDLTLSGAWWVAWHAGGGVLSLDRSEALDTAGEVLRWLLSRSTLQVDAGRLAVAVEALSAFRVGLYVDEPVSPWEVARRKLLRWLPVSVRSGDRGLYPIVWRWWATAVDAVATLDADEAGVVRVGPVKRTIHPREVASEVRLEFAGDASSSTKRVLTVAGEYSEGVQVSQEAAHAQRAFGRRSTTLSVSEVYDGPTAARIARLESLRRSGIPREITYEAPASEGWLREGDVVVVQDSALSLSRRVALITARQHTGDAVRLTVTILPDPAATQGAG